MSILWHSHRRRILTLVIGTAVIGLALASPASSRVEPAPNVISLNADPTPAIESSSITGTTTVVVRDAWGPVVYAPESLAVTSATTTTLSFAWSPVGRAADAISYRVYRNGLLSETDTDRQATMTGLGCGRTYTVSVVAQDDAGHSSAPAAIMASTVQCRNPDVPVTLSIPQSIGPGVALSATASGSISSIGFGYCAGTTTCTWAASTLIDTISGAGQADVRWSSPPPDGIYTVVVRAVATSGATGDSNPAIVSVDKTSPGTSIATGPNGFSPTTASFNFGSDETAGRFECNLDGSGFFPCLQGFTVTGLALGAHSLAVRAVDLAGNVDPSPVTTSWTVDVDPPDTTVLPGQLSNTPVSTATFTLGSTEPGTFECKIDNAGTFTPCSSFLSLTDFSTGAHKLTARAVDQAGNADPTPVVASWTATTPTDPPETTITSTPSGLINTRGVLVFFTSTNPFATFQCSVDNAAFAPCLNPRPINNLADGAHTFQVRSTMGGLTDPTPATSSWTVDATAPTVTITPSRPADGAGWYRNAVGFTTTGVDAGGSVTCTAAQSYGGPDVSHLSIVGACTDAAGNTRTKTFDLRYDTTAPSVRVAFRVRDRNGWYNRPFNVTWLGTDSGSGGVNCGPVQHYEGPDVAAATLTGTCTDAAGNSATVPFPFSYDDTDPTVTATPSRGPDVDSWYNAPVSVSFGGSDAMSGGVTCDAPVDYAGPDSGTATVTGTCTDAAGNPSPATLDLAYDATPPVVTAAAGRAPNSNGWYNAPVAVAFSGDDATSGHVSCDPTRLYAGPDTAAVSVLGSCSDAAGNYASGSVDLAYDATAPSVTVTARRAPDSGGAYTSPITFDVAGTDATSGGVTCDGPKTYSGPDSSTATVNGACTDAAGNQDTGSATFSYQTTTLDTNLLQTPATLTNHTSDQFTFSSTKTPATFTCVLDGTSSACSSPFTASNLTDGQHTFSVAARDGAGNTDATPASFTWTVDTVAPDTAFTAQPDPVSNIPAAFTISSEAGATFQCSLDGAAFTACTANVSIPLSALLNGSHTFRARALDGAGNADATPASVTWTVDTIVPTITLQSTPTSPSSATSFTFTWSTDEPATYSCKLDGGAFANCGSNLTSGSRALTGLTQGSHTFVLRARDAAGNITPLPGVSFTWTVDTGPPDTDLTPPLPANPTGSSSATFAFTATEPGSTFRCKLDNAAFAACTSPTTLNTLSDGSHTFSVAAVDTAGNVDATPASYTWLVDATSPTATISVPAEAATVSGTTTLTATANDNVSVLSVQFRLDGADLGSPLTSAPYTTTWDTTVTSDGPHTLTAVVKDEVANTFTTTAVHVTVSNSTTPPKPTATPDLVDVGPGNVDATTRNVIRTAAGRVYIIANDDQALSTRTSAGVIHAYKGNQAGTPTAFAEVDTANHPVSGGRTTATTAFGGADVRLGGDGNARVIYNDNASSQDLIFRTFSTLTDTWGPAEQIDAPVGTQERGRIKYALALDANNVPHVVYAKGTSLLYRNRIGGTWSAPVTIATGAPLHPMLAFDTTGVLHLTWLEDNGSGSSLRYATRTGTTWSTPELVPTGAILSNGNADQGPSIATDPAGHPYVLYVGPSLGTLGPVGHTALYGAIKIMEKVNGTWQDVSPAVDMKTHTPQVYLRDDYLYAFSGHDTDINFSYNRRLAGGAWGAETKLTSIVADGSASVRWDPLHETDSSIIDAATYNEDRLGDHSFKPELYYTAVLPSVPDSTAPTVSLTAPAAGSVGGTVTVSANASDNIGVAGVTFKVDGVTIGNEDTSAPYSVSWDSSTGTNGSHTLTAVARDAAGNTTTSTGVSVTVTNAAPPQGLPGALLFGATAALLPTDTNLPGQIEAFDVGTVVAGSLTRMHVFLDAPLPPSLLVGLYADNAGTPGALLMSTTIAAPVAGWNDVAFGPIALSLGKKYWVALLTPNGAANGPHFRDTKAGLGAGIFIANLGLSALPNPWPAGGTKNTDGPMSAYGTG